MTDNFNILVNKLNRFKNKYYTYKLIRGFGLVLFSLLTLFVLFSVAEYFIYLSSTIRIIIFYGYITFSFFLIAGFLVIPLLKILHIFTPITTQKSTILIQKHYPDIKDKLLNIIELSALKDSKYSNDLLLASIDQKINEIKLFNFSEAVQYKNIRFLFISLIISILTSISIYFINQKVFIDSTQRLINYNEIYTKPSPFTFTLENEHLKALKGEPLTLIAKCTGDEIPQIVYINIEGNNYLMKRMESGIFEFEISAVINPVQFYFTDLQYNSEKYNIQLLPKPAITNFITEIFPPAYTNLNKNSFENIGDLEVPHGTLIKWNFKGLDVDSLSMEINDSIHISSIKNENQFTIQNRFFVKSKYNVIVENRQTQPELALNYTIEILPDLFPEISVQQVADSTKLTRFFFQGVIGDDYGFSDLAFHLNINHSDSSIAIPFVKSLTDQKFYFSYDFADIKQNKGIINYYFTVTDNDAINKFKTTSSESFSFIIPDKEEILASEKEQFEALQKLLTKSQEVAKDIQKDLQNLRLKNMDANVSDWEKSQMVNDIVQKQNQLEQLQNQLKQNNQALNNYVNSFQKQNEDIVEKQKQIEELIEEIFTEELKELMEEFNKLADEFNSEKLNQLSRDMDLSIEDLQKQLDRNLEMLRKMKMEEKLQGIIDEINRLASEENKLADEISEQRNYKQVEEEVQEHKDLLNDLELQLNETLELNKELTEPMLLDDFDEDFDDIQKSFDNNINELQKRNRKKSGSGLKKTSEKLQNLAFAMQQMLNSNTMEQNMENIENLKQILSNLMFLSFEQENILNGLTAINSADPRLVEFNRTQKKLIDQSEVVKDSLYALAMRTPHITSMVNNELLILSGNLTQASEQMQEGLFPNARAKQQFVVTAANNLALMLNEALEQLEKQMADAMEGDQQCENPGNGKPGMGAMKKASQSIKKQLEQMIEQMKNGNPQQMSQQLGQSLMQHEMMQQMLRELMNNGSVGSGTREMLQEIDNMLEQNRKELINKRINTQTIARQNLITTRLLEAEKAELEREFEEKRESESAEDFYSNPVKFFEYKEKENYSIELINKNTHKLNTYYNYKYKQYLNNIQKSSDK